MQVFRDTCHRKFIISYLLRYATQYISLPIWGIPWQIVPDKKSFYSLKIPDFTENVFRSCRDFNKEFAVIADDGKNFQLQPSFIENFLKNKNRNRLGKKLFWLQNEKKSSFFLLESNEKNLNTPSKGFFSFDTVNWKFRVDSTKSELKKNRRFGMECRIRDERISTQRSWSTDN